MKILQALVKTSFTNEPLWMDLIELPPTINNLKEWQAAATKDMGQRQVRIIEVLET